MTFTSRRKQVRIYLNSDLFIEFAIITNSYFRHNTEILTPSSLLLVVLRHHHWLTNRRTRHLRLIRHSWLLLLLLLLNWHSLCNHGIAWVVVSKATTRLLWGRSQWVHVGGVPTLLPNDVLIKRNESLLLNEVHTLVKVHALTLHLLQEGLSLILEEPRFIHIWILATKRLLLSQLILESPALLLRGGVWMDTSSLEEVEELSRDFL